MLLLLPSTPPKTTSQFTSVSVVEITLSSINPSASKILVPRPTIFGRFLYVTETRSFDPTSSRAVSVKRCFSFKTTSPFSNCLMRISGPFVSIIIGSAMPSLSRIRLTLSICFLCDAWSPWLILNRATFIPAATISAKTRSSSHAGPIVAIIFAFLISSPLLIQFQNGILTFTALITALYLVPFFIAALCFTEFVFPILLYSSSAPHANVLINN